MEPSMSASDNLPAIVVREMREADTIDVHRIHTECLTTSLIDHYSPQALEAWMFGRSPEGYWRFANAGETFRVAEIEGGIVGFANWRDRELRSLFVTPMRQRSGVGSVLFSACEREASLNLVKATLGAVGFYQRFSFIEVERGFDLKRGVRLPHIVMRRHLD
jgi:GNAT superfamily N-acetyltransferase